MKFPLAKKDQNVLAQCQLFELLEMCLLQRAPTLLNIFLSEPVQWL